MDYSNSRRANWQLGHSQDERKQNGKKSCRGVDIIFFSSGDDVIEVRRVTWPLKISILLAPHSTDVCAGKQQKDPFKFSPHGTVT